MICQIHDRYVHAKQLGGDSELLASSIVSAFEYVDGPLRKRMS